MKKCIFLNLFLLLMSINLTANSPGGHLTGKPLPRGSLPYQALLSDWGAVPIKVNQPDSNQVVTESAAPTAQGFSFPDLDQQILAAIEEELPNNIGADNMMDLLNIPPTAEETEAMQAIEAAQAGGTHVDNFDDLLDLKLPAYRIQKIGNLEAIIIINSLKLVTGNDVTDGLGVGGRLGIYVGVKIPQKNYDSQLRKKNITLIFGTEALAFTKEGGIKTGNIRLLNDVGFELGGSAQKAVVFLKKGNAAATEGTYIKFGCNGVEEFSLDAEVHFSREWLLRVDADGNPLNTTDRVVGGFSLKVQDWNNMLVGVTIDHFTLAKWPKMSFAIGNAYVDLSDFSNPPNVKFPDGYLLPPQAKLWRGVFIETIEVTFPEPFQRKCDGNYGLSNDPAAPTCRMKVGAKDLIIDNMGVSGAFDISGQAPIAAGNLMNKSWSWSLNEIGVNITASKFTGFNFSGGIVIPVAKKERPLQYEAFVQWGGGDGNQEQTASYDFNIKLEEDMEFPLFKAFKVKLASNSTLNVALENGAFKPSAVLHGSLSIGKGDSKDVARVPKIRFSDFSIDSEGPQYINGGNFFIEGGGNFFNDFPVQITGIGLGFNENSAHLAFNMGLHLMQQKDGGLTTTGNFKIHGKHITNIIGAQEWQFDRFEMSGFEVVIDLPAFKGCGALDFFEEDPVYGKGFNSYLSASVLGSEAKLTGNFMCGDHVEGAFNISMAAIFGTKDGMRYFMVDGFVSSDQISVPLAPTPLKLSGFGGGVQYRMKVVGHKELQNNGPAIPAGMDTSGLIYEPDPNSLFGIKFAVAISTVGAGSGGGSPLNGRLAVIIRFGSGLSLQNITFWGTAEFINPAKQNGIQAAPPIGEKVPDLALKDAERHQKDQDEVKDTQDKIVGKVGISLDFDAGFSFHGYAQVKMNTAGGKINGRGQMDLLIDPNSSSIYPNGRWHLYLGGYDNEEIKVPDFLNPENEITLMPVSVSIDYDALKVTAQAYFLIGNDIPGPPPVNAEAAKIFGVTTEANDENRDLLTCNGNNPSKGTGIAFGAAMHLKLEKKVRKKIGFIRVTLVNIKVNGGAGFDIALLQYPENSHCANTGQNPHGLNSFRATGNIWGYIDVSGKVLGVRLPSIGVGALLRADVPNPSYFDVTVVLQFIKRWRFNFDIGDECGHPYNCP